MVTSQECCPTTGTVGEDAEQAKSPLVCKAQDGVVKQLRWPKEWDLRRTEREPHSTEPRAPASPPAASLPPGQLAEAIVELRILRKEITSGDGTGKGKSCSRNITAFLPGLGR